MSGDKSLFPLVALQGLAALMVFTFHASSGGGWVMVDPKRVWFSFSPFLQRIANDGISWVSFFFVASGFTMAYAYQDKIMSGQASVADYAVARASRIVPLAWAMSTAAALLYYISFEKFGDKWFDLTRLFGDYLFLNGNFLNKANNAMNQPVWYLTPQIAAYMAFFALLRSPPPPTHTWGPVPRYVIAVLFALLVCGMNLPIPVLLPNFFRAFAGFFSGCVYCRMWKFFAQGRVKSAFTSICAVIMVICWYFYVYHRERMVSNWIFVLSCFQYPCTIITFLNVRPIAFIAALPPFQWLGKLSFGIFLNHWTILMGARLLREYGVISFADGSRGALVIIFSVLMAFSALTYYFIELPARAFIRKKYKDYKDGARSREARPGN